MKNEEVLGNTSKGEKILVSLLTKFNGAVKMLQKRKLFY